MAAILTAIALWCSSSLGPNQQRCRDSMLTCIGPSNNTTAMDNKLLACAKTISP